MRRDLRNKQLTVLIIDDEEQIAQIISKYLQLYKGFHNIIIASDGVQAMQKISNQEFDLIITDIMMPKRDGFTLIDNLRKIPKYYNQKIMIVSGCINKDMTIAAMKRGIKQIVVKPFSARQILEKAFEALDLDKNPKQMADQIIIKVSDRLVKRKALLEGATADGDVSDLFDAANSGKE